MARKPIIAAHFPIHRSWQTTKNAASALISPTTATPNSPPTCAAPSRAPWATRRNMLERPIVGIAQSASGFNNCHRNVPELVEAVKRGVLGAGGLPVDFPTISLGEVFLSPTSLMFRNLMAMDVEEMVRAQPMDAVVLDRRLRQDCSCTTDGRGVSGHPGGSTGHRAHDGDALPRRASRRLYRLPAFLGEVSRRRSERRRHRRNRRQSGDDGRHMRGNGHGEHHGLYRGGTGNDVFRIPPPYPRCTRTACVRRKRPACGQCSW